MKIQIWLMFPLLCALSFTVSAQKADVNGGYTHISGDGGLDGFNVGASVWFSRRLSMGFDYDSGWDTSHLGVFELTQTGVIVTKSHLQNFLVGPRIFFPGVLKSEEKHIAKLIPFAEVELGASHLNSSLESPSAGTSQSASDNAFSWMVGGGADYRFSAHLAGRFKLDFLRTHFADTGQSRARLVVGIMYSLGRMFPTEAEQAAEARRKADAEQAAADARKKAALEQAEARKKATIEQVEHEKLAAEEAAAAKWKADSDLAAAEARKKVAMEQLAAQEAAGAKTPDAKPKNEGELAAVAARKEAMEQNEKEKEILRARLLDHFNRVLPTTDTPRGLVVDMDDALFDFGKSDLRPEGREDLAKVSGIVLNYPSLRLTIEGHTDNQGNAEFNQTLSEQRANTVRDYLIKQGLASDSLTAQGLGEKNPVADNSTPEGRQKNRRVEVIVSGEIIGMKVGK